MRLKEIYEILDDLAPFESALSWDNVGLIAGDMESRVNSVYLALDGNDQVIEEAREKKCELILTHHPFIFSGIKRICSDDMTGRRVIQVLSNGISVVSMHTNFDVWVMADIVAKKLEMKDYSVLEETEERDGKVLGIGTIGGFKDNKTMSLEEIARFVKNKFNLPFVTYYGDKDRKLSKVAIVPGSGKSDIDVAIAKGADVLITGDITYHDGTDAVAKGLSIVDAGHYGLEHIFSDYMYDYLCDKLNDVIIYKHRIDFPRGVV